MSLLMYAYATKLTFAKPVDFQHQITDYHAIHEWTNHPDLNGWMEQLYEEKGGDAKHLDCVMVQLTSDDLDQLEHAIRTNTLPQCQAISNTFLRMSRITSDGSETQQDLAFIAKARQAIRDGFTVCYEVWD